jgi:hypothetical protein
LGFAEDDIVERIASVIEQLTDDACVTKTATVEQK